MGMEQCGDDEEFLRELLSDLRGEIDEVLKKKMDDQAFLLIMRASHVIKGASSNLMCQQLREGSTNLEQAAAVGSNGVSKEDVEKVREKYAELREAVDNYHAFLDR